MESVTYRITLDTNKSGIQKTLQGFATEDKMSRKICINLTSSGDTYEISQDVMALMYVKSPSASEPSIERCVINNNTVEYDVVPLTEEGITIMQLKLIQTDADGAKSVIVSPGFAVEVEDVGFDDEEAEQTATFSALEDAVAQARATYDGRLIRVEFDEEGAFHAYYADGTEYTNTDFGKMFTSAIEASDNAKASEDLSLLYCERAERSSQEANSARLTSEINALSTEKNAERVEEALNEINKKTIYTSFYLDPETGNLMYDSQNYRFYVDTETGNLCWDIL